MAEQQILLSGISIADLTDIVRVSVREALAEQNDPKPVDLGFLTRKQVLEQFKLDSTTLWRYTRDDRHPLNFYRMGRRQYFKKSEIEEYLKRKFS